MTTSTIATYLQYANLQMAAVTKGVRDIYFLKR